MEYSPEYLDGIEEPRTLGTSLGSAQDVSRPTHLHPSSMSKRHVTGYSRSRKKRKGSDYASVDLDLPSDHEVEAIRVWDVGVSKTTGRVSGTRKTHKHVRNGPSKPTQEEPAPIAADVGIPPDPEPSGQPPIMLATKRKKAKAKENDSVSSVPVPLF